MIMGIAVFGIVYICALFVGLGVCKCLGLGE